MKELRVKIYPPHFDKLLTQQEAESVASSPQKVASHSFYPFLQRNQHWTRFARKNAQKSDVQIKNRPIKYAARCDSFIFGFYRRLLSPRYESLLEELSLQDSVLAYRRLRTTDNKSGKCNIHFADDAFKLMREIGDCYAVAMDISQFFENLDHEHLKCAWSKLLTEPTKKNAAKLLPDDHYRVFRALTSYSYADVQEVYKELELIVETTDNRGRKSWKYARKRDEFPIQICAPKEFQQKIVPLLKHNENPYGIPQGSPISDLLANLYMLDFDVRMNRFASAQGGRFFRYSDDLLIVVPTGLVEWPEVISETLATLQSCAPRLKLKDSKTQVYKYTPIDGGPNQSNVLLDGPKGADGLEYLGFRYDGRRVYLRNSTVSGVQRKITAAAKKMARMHVDTHPGLAALDLINTFNYSALISKFGRVREFDNYAQQFNKWTFWTYVKRSNKILGDLGKPITRQFGGYKSFSRKKVIETIQHYVHRKQAAEP